MTMNAFNSLPLFSERVTDGHIVVTPMGTGIVDLWTTGTVDPWSMGIVDLCP